MTLLHFVASEQQPKKLMYDVNEAYEEECRISQKPKTERSLRSRKENGIQNPKCNEPIHVVSYLQSRINRILN